MRMRCNRVFLAALLTMVGVGRVMAYTAPSITTTADTFVSANNVNSNYGGAGAIEVSASSSANTTGEFEGLLRFNLNSTIANLNSTFGTNNYYITSVRLQLTSMNSSNNALFNSNKAGSFSVIRMANPEFSEGTGTPNSSAPADGVTYATLPNYVDANNDQNAGTFTFAGGNGNTATYSLTLTSGLLSDVSSGGDLGLHVIAADSVVSYLFNSRSFGTVASRPMLLVDAVAPEPTCGAALLIVGAATLRRRRRSA